MANTKHVSIRLPFDLVETIDQSAKGLRRSRAYLIEVCLRSEYGNGRIDESDTGAAISGVGSGARLPILPKTKSPTKRLHSVQPLREELAGRVGHIQPSPHEGHRILNAGGRGWCSDCKCFVDGQP